MRSHVGQLRAEVLQRDVDGTGQMPFVGELIMIAYIEDSEILACEQRRELVDGKFHQAPAMWWCAAANTSAASTRASMRMSGMAMHSQSNPLRSGPMVHSHGMV